MKTRLQFLYVMCYNVNYFVSQPVGLDFTSGSGLLVGLDMKAPWARLYHVTYTQPWYNNNGGYLFIHLTHGCV